VPDDLPTGTVTFLFSDIEGSTRLLEQLGTSYAQALSTHRQLIRSAVRVHGGTEVSSEGDEFFAAFSSAPAAVNAAADAQRALSAHAWSADTAFRVRMGVHTGIGVLNDGAYVGLDVHRAARIMAAAHGGQVLASHATRVLAANGLSQGLTFRDLGQHRLKDFPKGDHLFQVSGDGLATSFPPPRTLDAAVGNLPTELAPFVGRKREIRDLVRLIFAGRRLVTITGPGGIGKSRLSLEVAHRVTGRFADGVWFVPLAPIMDDELVRTAIARSLGVQLGVRQDPLDTIADHLAGAQTLLVLDNVEQVHAGAARTALRLLSATARTQVLATGRMAFHVRGEREVIVPPLALPRPDESITPQMLGRYEATALFARLATAARPGFRLNAGDAATVAGIVSHLDGLPLAFELAAARVRLLTVQEILRGLDSPLRLLAGGPVDLPERQQTMRAAIDWSLGLLDPATQDLFARLGAFVGGWTAADAEAVCGAATGSGDVFERLGTLVDHNLVRRSEIGDTTRFEMLETIRASAGERLEALTDAGETRRRHARLYLDLAESLAPAASSSAARASLDALDREHDNIRAAMDWAIHTRDVETVLRFVAALWRFWYMRGYLLEGRSKVEAVLALPELDAHRPALASGLSAAGAVFYWLADPRAEAAYERSLALYRGLGDRRAIASALYDLSFVVGAARRAAEVERSTAGPEQRPRTPVDLERSRQLLEESKAISREVQDLEGEARAAFGLANLAAMRDDASRSRDLAREAVELYRQTGDDPGLSWALHLHAVGALGSGQIDLARASLAEGLPLVREIGDLTGILFYLDGFAIVAQERGALERAMRISGAADALERKLGIPAAQAGGTFLGNRTARKSLLTARDLADAWAEGEEMTADEAVTYALQPDNA